MTQPNAPWGQPHPQQTPQPEAPPAWGPPQPQEQAPQGWGAPQAPQQQAPAPQAPAGWGQPQGQPQPQAAPAYGQPPQGYSMPSQPQAPAPGGFVQPSQAEAERERSGNRFQDFAGALLIVEPLRIQPGVVAGNRAPQDVTVANVTVLDGPKAGTVEREMYIFARVVQGQLRSLLGTGREMLGRLGQGTGQDGNSPPWILMDYTDADLNTAAQYKEWQRQQNGGQPPF